MTSLLTSLGLSPTEPGVWSGAAASSAKGGTPIDVHSPIDAAKLGTVQSTTRAEYDAVIARAQSAFQEWRTVPAPRRGELIRKIGEALRVAKAPLGELVTTEVGKILAEGGGEIQEAIDMADFAVGLSRQLYGKVMQSERNAHFMMEQWHPLGPIGVITAFNFPAAVWAWNAFLAAVCGDVVIWKPSELAPLTALAIHKIASRVAEEEGMPEVFHLICGGRDVGTWLTDDERVPLISATGSCGMGRVVGERVARRFGRSLLELGGNNAIIVLADADLDLVTRGTVFGAVGTAGQRCTTTRRLLVAEPIFDEVVTRLKRAYAQVKIGDPRKGGVLMGPLISDAAVERFVQAVKLIQQQGGEVLYGGNVLSDMPSGRYVEPTLVRAPRSMPIVQEETFAPILYLTTIQDVEDGIAIQNGVRQGLSSAIFTRDVQAAHRFLSATGSDCGIANVNIGTSGAEIGGAFGGEKETGGGREAGSDSWKQYMRRQTVTLNYSSELPLAQGIRFDV